MTTLDALTEKKASIAVVGLGYVGLPLAVGLARHFRVIGMDVNERRVADLACGLDRTGEVDAAALNNCSVEFSADPGVLKEAAVIIVAVPTPIDKHLRPDLGPMESATRSVGQNMQAGAVVVFESTVYPGVTEEVCVPILEAESGFKFGEEFSVGYSPERINPGDKVHTVETIVKVVAGSDAPTLELLSGIYGKVVKAGIHKASSIKVAEAAKVIENTQRDINIALMNELAMIFDRMGIDTLEVLEAAGTKWNFISFRPGLVGGHCIGVDPYYLTFKAQELGYHPEVILAGRRINDNMGKYVAETCVKQMIQQGCAVKNARVGILGLTFKENVTDLRNTRVVDIVDELEDYGVKVLVHDPLADAGQAQREYNLHLYDLDNFQELDALILAVPHDAYRELVPEALKGFFKPGTCEVLLDLKGFWDPAEFAAAGLYPWRL